MKGDVNVTLDKKLQGIVIREIVFNEIIELAATRNKVSQIWQCVCYDDTYFYNVEIDVTITKNGCDLHILELDVTKFEDELQNELNTVLDDESN